MNIISLFKILTTQELHQEKVEANSFKLQPFLIWSQKNKGIHLKFGEIVRYQRDGALSPIIMAPCRIPGAATYVNSVCCWFSPLLQKVFLRILWLHTLPNTLSIVYFDYMAGMQCDSSTRRYHYLKRGILLRFILPFSSAMPFLDDSKLSHKVNKFAHQMQEKHTHVIFFCRSGISEVKDSQM